LSEDQYDVSFYQIFNGLGYSMTVKINSALYPWLKKIKFYPNLVHIVKNSCTLNQFTRACRTKNLQVQLKALINLRETLGIERDNLENFRIEFTIESCRIRECKQIIDELFNSMEKMNVFFATAGMSTLRFKSISVDEYLGNIDAKLTKFKVKRYFYRDSSSLVKQYANQALYDVHNSFGINSQWKGYRYSDPSSPLTWFNRDKGTPSRTRLSEMNAPVNETEEQRNFRKKVNDSIRRYNKKLDNDSDYEDTGGGETNYIQKISQVLEEEEDEIEQEDDLEQEEWCLTRISEDQIKAIAIIVHLQTIFKNHYIHYKFNVFFYNFENVKKHMGGYYALFSPKIYDYWINNYTPDIQNKIELNLKKFILSREYKLIILS